MSWHHAYVPETELGTKLAHDDRIATRLELTFGSDTLDQGMGDTPDVSLKLLFGDLGYFSLDGVELGC